MADEKELAHAKNVFNDLCTKLDKMNWHYNKDEEKLVVTFDVSGDDFPMSFIIMIDADRQLMRMFSRLPFTVPEDKRMDLAVATCVASNGLPDGSFDYDILKGNIDFRLTSSFRGSTIGEGLFEYLVGYSSALVDRYNDKFFAIAKGFLNLNDFIEQE